MVDKTIHNNLLIDYALGLVEDDKVSAEHLLLCALKAMAPDDVSLMLDNNELTPRFFERDQNSYHVRFKGRKVGAIGAVQEFELVICAPYIWDVKSELYETHEHITGLCISATTATQESGS